MFSTKSIFPINVSCEIRWVVRKPNLLCCNFPSVKLSYAIGHDKYLLGMAQLEDETSQDVNGQFHFIECVIVVHNWKVSNVSAHIVYSCSRMSAL